MERNDVAKWLQRLGQQVSDCTEEYEIVIRRAEIMAAIKDNIAETKLTLEQQNKLKLAVYICYKASSFFVNRFHSYSHRGLVLSDLKMSNADKDKRVKEIRAKEQRIEEGLLNEACCALGKFDFTEEEIKECVDKLIEYMKQMLLSYDYLEIKTSMYEYTRNEMFKMIPDVKKMSALV